jgi:hypothetical protein
LHGRYPASSASAPDPYFVTFSGFGLAEQPGRQNTPVVRTALTAPMSPHAPSLVFQV